MSRPPPDAVCDTHRVIPHEIRILADLHSTTELLRAELRTDVESPVAVATGDVVAARSLRDTVRADVEVVTGALPFFPGVGRCGLCGF